MAAVVAALAFVAPMTFDQIALPVTALLSPVAIAMFFVAVFDGRTRKAVDAFNLQYNDLSWRERIFSSKYGDRRLLFINRLIWLEMLALMFTGNLFPLFVLGFIGFALSGLMMMLMFKLQPDLDMQNGS